MRLAQSLACSACIFAAALSHAQSPAARSPAHPPPTVDHVDHWTPQDLLAKAQQLEAPASAGTGSASTRLTEYPNHFTMIALRQKNGGAEIHDQFADIFYVLKGHARLMSGGAVVDAKTIKPGETQGTSLKDATATELKEGDIVHIPTGVPHQLLLPEGGEFVYFVIKVQESD